MLEIRRLTKRFNGIPAVEDISFRICPGEILGYLGPNGAGKSTTVKMIIGLIEPSEGQILFEGRSIIDDLPAFQRRIGADSSWVTIVGIAGDIAHSTMEREPAPMVYVPYLQHPERGMDIGLRTAGDPMRAAAAVTSVIRSIDREQPITNLNTLETLIRQDALGLAYMAGLMGVFGALALALSSIGVYGVTAYLVSQQRHEIGVRLALGAPHRTVLGMVFRRGMLGAGAGLAIGLPLAYGLARVMEAASFGLTAIDPGIFVGIPAMLAALAGLATYIPARRAMDVDPIEALRSE